MTSTMPRPQIARLMREHDVSDIDLAQRLNVNRSTVWRWRCGTHAIPDRRKAQVAEVLGVSVATLMGLER